MTHWIVVSHDPKWRSALHQSLKNAGHRATLLDHSDSLAAAIPIHRPDVVLLDLTPGHDGFEACKRLRSWNSIPLIVCSNRKDVEIKVEALDAGADDYLVKPVVIDELLARLRAVQRRSVSKPSSHAPIVEAGMLTINFDNHVVLLAGKSIDLTHREYELLKALILARGHAVTYKDLLERIGGKPTTDARSVTRTIVTRLRTKLGENLDQPSFILTESGVGYRFNSMLLPVIELT